jgi:hypothetical protein
MNTSQKNPLNTSDFNWICERCQSDFIVPENYRNSLVTAATHCAICTSALSALFSASLFCNCNQYCLDSKCVSSDSGLKVAKCWCADCKEMRKEVKANAYKTTTTKAGK